VRCPIELTNSVAETGCSRAFRWICHPSCPLPLPEVLRLARLATLPASARRMKPVAWIRQAVHRVAALCYPSPSRVWDRAADHLRSLHLPAFPRSLGWLVNPAAFAIGELPVWQAIWIATMNSRPPHIAVGLRRLSVVTCATLFRSIGPPPA